MASPGVAHFVVALSSTISLMVCTFRRKRGNSLFMRGTPTTALSMLTQTLGRACTRISPGCNRARIGAVNAHRNRGLCRALMAHRRVTGTISVNSCCHVPYSAHSLGCSGFFARNGRSVTHVRSCRDRGATHLSIRNVGGLLLGLHFVHRSLKVRRGTGDTRVGDR